MRFAIRRRIGSGGTVRLQWLFRTNSVVGRTEEQVRSHINLPAASYEAAYWVERNLSSYDEVVRDVIYLRSGASFEREAEAPAALHLVVPPELDKRGYWKGTGFTGVYWLQPGQPVYGHPSYRHSYEKRNTVTARTHLWVQKLVSWQGRAGLDHMTLTGRRGSRSGWPGLGAQAVGPPVYHNGPPATGLCTALRLYLLPKRLPSLVPGTMACDARH